MGRFSDVREKAVPWMGVGLASWRVWGSGMGSGGRGLQIQCRNGPERSPVRMVFPWRVMVRWEGVKVAVQPWSQSWLMDRREPVSSWGNRWQVNAEGGKPGMMRFPVCVDWMGVPSAVITVTGCRAGARLATWPVT